MVRMWFRVVGLALVGALFVDAAALRRTRQAASERVRDGRPFSMTKKHSRALTEGKRTRFFGNGVHRDAQRGANGLVSETRAMFVLAWFGPASQSTLLFFMLLRCSCITSAVRNSRPVSPGVTASRY
jgi:hypothetical protein